MSEGDRTKYERPSRIPGPSDFPVVWEHPGDESLYWNPDPLNFPEPVTPVMEGLAQAFTEGFKRTAQYYDLTIRFRYRRINSYMYGAMVPMVPHEELGALAKKSEAKLEASLVQFPALWNTRWLPEVKKNLAFWEAFDLQGASQPVLLAHLEDTWRRLTRLWEIHALIAVPFLLGPSLFDELYHDLFGKEGALDAYRLLQGFGNKTVESDLALWQLSRKAGASPPVHRVFQTNAPANVKAALEGSAEGRAFGAELRSYLEEYGQRSDVFAELSCPHWIEDPRTPIRNLQEYLGQPDRDPGGEMAALAAERERLIAQARGRLQKHPRHVVERFETLLKAAQLGTVFHEDHNYWIDQRGMYQVRRVLLEFGRRFAEAGVMGTAGDVFYLTPGEIRQAAIALPQGDRRRLVAERRAEMDHFRTIQPPPLGIRPGESSSDDPLGRAITKFLGPPPQKAPSVDVLLGNAGSPGKVRGTAKVVLSLGEAGKLRPGDVLVAPSTMPAWTPLFAIAAAVVTDTGGILSHCAIVAREYNIPAVLGTGRATAVIQDGQVVEVDGDAGLVRLLSHV